MANIGASIESMSYLAGSVLQIAKQILSLRHGGKPKGIASRRIGSQSLVEVIWEGRNHAMHWEETVPHKKVKEMFDLLASDFGMDVEYGKNNCLSLLGVLSWSSADQVIQDLHELTSEKA